MVLQVKDAGETGAGKFRLAPGTIRFLAMNQVSHCFLDRRIFHSRAREQADESPRSLRGGAGALSLGGRQIVAEKRFAKAAVHFLDAAEPDDRALAEFSRGERNGFQGAQDPARSVNVIDAPAAEPRTVFALILQQKLHCALNDGVVGRPAMAAEALNDTSGDVGCRRVNHSVVIGKGNVAEEFSVIVAVERTPATVPILHAEEPLQTTL